MQRLLAEHFDMKCDYCDKLFTSLADAQNHYNTQHDIRNGYIKCCGHQYTKFQSARGHLLFHMKPYLFQCVWCTIQLNSLDAFKQHAKGHNEHLINKYIKSYDCESDLDSEAAEQLAMNKVQCNICKKWLVNKTSLQTHKKLHFDEPQPCPHCDRVCLNKPALKEHIKVMHELSRTLICHLCGRAFKKKYALKVSFFLLCVFSNQFNTSKTICLKHLK